MRCTIAMAGALLSCWTAVAFAQSTAQHFRAGSDHGDGGYFIRDSEIHYEMAASKDKDFIVIEGATHGGTPCTACETTPGQYSNTAKNFVDYVAKWINAR